jgi:hypothetical protein
MYNIIFSGNDTSQFFLVLKVEIISAPVVVVVVAVVLEVEIISTLVAVVAVVGLCRGRSSSWSRRFYSVEVVVVVVEVEIISTLVAVVAVGGGGDYLDTCSSKRRSISRALLFGVCPVDN